MESPLHTIYISFPPEVTQQVKTIYDAIVTACDNTNSFPVDWVPHIDVFTARVKPEDSSEYVELFNSLNMKSFKNTICLEKLEISDNGKFIFITPNEESKAYIYKLRTYLEMQLGKYKDLTLTEFFKSHWDTYTKDQQERILKTGGYYEYNPHFTVIKLSPDESRKAFEIAKKYFKPIMFEVGLKLTAQNLSNEYLFETKAIKEFI